MTWQEQAACLNHPNPDAWFPAENSDAATAEARAVCYRCPVVNDCATYALDTNQRYGIWGGLTTAARDRITKYTPIQINERRRHSSRDMCTEIEHLIAVGGRTVESIARSYGITVHAMSRAFYRQGKQPPLLVRQAEHHARNQRTTNTEEAAA